MVVKEAIKALLKDNKKSQVWLAEKMGYTKPTAINNMLARGNLTVETLYKICEIMEYEITIQPKRRSGARPAGQILIEWVEPEKKETSEK